MRDSLAIALGLIPLGWLAGYRATGLRHPVSWWLMAAAFAVSFVADMVSFPLGHQFVSQLYVVAQGALAAYAVAPRVADRFVPVMLAAAGVSFALRRGEGLDWLLHVVAWGGVAWLAMRDGKDGLLVASVLVYFAGGALVWPWFVAARASGDLVLMDWTLLAYQGTRMVGIALWCAAATLHHSPRTAP